MEQVQVIAGSVAGIIFAAGSCGMLWKAWRSKDLSSYSLSQLWLTNIGNLFYWLYVLSLPFGPIYFMHGFCTFVYGLMLVWYFMYQPNASVITPIQSKLPAFTSCLHASGR